MSFLLYGASGYTGGLIARAALARGLRPILAGRSEKKLAPLARELALEVRCFPLREPILIAEQLVNVPLVLHCAGPFSATSAPMLQACLKAKVDYLDISGEISTFEYAHARHLEAAAAGVVVCPGVGFDVVPTDCLAATLKAALPDATELALGFDSSSALSPGTAKTMIENLPLGGCVRRDGKLVEVPHMRYTRHIDFGAGEKLAATIPWGDVATAYFTTGIPNIEVYVPMPRSFVRLAKLGGTLRYLTASSLVQGVLKKLVEGNVMGPDAAARARQDTYVWGEVKNAAGAKRTARVKTANSYALTVNAALGVVEQLLAKRPAGGYFTPSQLMGADFVTRLPDSGPILIE
jgi:short subunit dehydrogenase-like uncharacterized protein